MAEFLWRNYRNKETPRDLRTVLKATPLFDDLNRHHLRAIEKILHRRQYAPGEYIFREGELGTGMYVIESGEVSIFYGHSTDEMVRLGEGEFFGELGILIEAPRTSSAVAVSQTHLLGFFQPDLFGLLETRPSIGVSVLMKIARIVAERLSHAVEENHRLLEELKRHHA